ncbi:hypothetical protein CFC21_009839 [Triticum aestivum]|uniref:Uncharacterized protein n=2 Tax=Triticum aestivum TaxID=4565 RepID=A0A3B5ZMK2_WHEAT|nr:hypothetical protein CFC21_009839 [Triticum aestivum]
MAVLRQLRLVHQVQSTWVQTLELLKVWFFLSSTKCKSCVMSTIGPQQLPVHDRISDFCESCCTPAAQSFSSLCIWIDAEKK